MNIKWKSDEKCVRRYTIYNLFIIILRILINILLMI